jgi:hypothetical protein
VPWPALGMGALEQPQGFQRGSEVTLHRHPVQARLDQDGGRKVTQDQDKSTTSELVTTLPKQAATIHLLPLDPGTQHLPA